MCAFTCVSVYVCTYVQVAAAGSWQDAWRTTLHVPHLCASLWRSMRSVWDRMVDASELHGRIVLVGWSTGCVAATEWALQHPERVRALLLCSGAPSAQQAQDIAAGRRILPETLMTIGDKEPSPSSPPLALDYLLTELRFAISPSPLRY